MLLGMSIVIVQLTIDNSLRFALCCHSSSHDMSLETCIGCLKRNTIIKKKDEHRSYVFSLTQSRPKESLTKTCFTLSYFGFLKGISFVAILLSQIDYQTTTNSHFYS